MSIKMNEVTRQVWDTLMKRYENPYGVAGLMGNLYAESKINPQSCGGLKDGMTRAEYIQNVKDGAIDQETFSHDGVAFGIAQWRYWSRKSKLYSWCQELKDSLPMYIDDLYQQLMYLIVEISGYAKVEPVLFDATDIREASDAVLKYYERPKDVSEAAQLKRLNYAKQFYDAYANDMHPKKKYAQLTTDKVNIRSGNGKQFSIICKKEPVGSVYEWIATSENNWHAVLVRREGFKDRIGWISGEFCEIIEK